MSSQSADQPAADQTPAPIGLRELPPQPAKPVMPAYAMPSLTPAPAPAPVPQERPAGPGPDDSVIARDDHVEGTFTSRGTVVVMGSLKGRIEANRVRIEDGAHVDADVIVDEAIVAGEFTGNLTCRERLEARASGRINGRVETYRLMLHEGASVEGEMHMISEAPRDASTTIRGSAPLRGEPGAEAKAEATPRTAGTSASAGTSTSAGTSRPASPTPAATTGSAAPIKSAPVVTPSSAAKPATAKPTQVGGVSGAPSGDPTGRSSAASSVATSPAPATQMTVPGLEDPGTPRRSPVAEALRLETLLVAPRTMNTGTRPGGSVGTNRPGSVTSTSSRPRNGTTTAF
jgi:cytoskeletal protein CcmA (bactofilin family)